MIKKEFNIGDVVKIIKCNFNRNNKCECLGEIYSPTKMNIIYTNCVGNYKRYFVRGENWCYHNMPKQEIGKLSKLDRLIAVKYKFGVKHIPTQKGNK